MFEKILVPLDGSKLSERVLPLALDLAEAVNGEVILLRGVLPVHLATSAIAEEYDWSWPVSSREQLRREAWHYLRGLVATWERDKVVMQPLAVEGDAASVIVDTAAAEDVNLIVMSSHGSSRRVHSSLGGITERVLHSACCPVLIVRTLEPITHILIALDGSELAERSLAPGLNVAQQLKVPVMLLHVNEPVTLDMPLSFVTTWQQSETCRYWDEHAREEASLYLNEVKANLMEKGVAVQTAVLDGATVQTILDHATKHQGQLIVMTTHGRSGLQRWLYGSVTAKVLRSSDSSMLIIRPPTETLE